MTERRHAPLPARPPGPRKIAGPVVAGVVPGQPPVVVRLAADLAYSLGVELVCAYVDVTTYLVREAADGSVSSMPVDPDIVDDDAENLAVGIRTSVDAHLHQYEVPWSFVTLAGDPSRALGHLAETVHASMLVVGTRERGIGARLEELLVGSVAVHLTHRQHRPVLVVPLNPRRSEGEAP